MTVNDSCGVTIYQFEVATKQSSTVTSGSYSATYNGQPYTLPQEYQGKSSCAPVAYGVGTPTKKT